MAVDFAIADLDTHLFGLAEAHATLRAMEYRLDHMHEPLEEIVSDIHRQTLAAFVSHGAALGEPWEALDPSTVAEKTGRYPFPDWPLVASGQLMISATGDGDYSLTDIGQHTAELALDFDRDGWNIAALQQTGVPRREVTQNRHHEDGSGYTVSFMWHLPARPYWKATDHLAEEGADHIVDFVMGPVL